MGRVELTYGRAIKKIMDITNPIKKMLMKTNCITHKFINNNSIQILNNESLYNISIFIKKYIDFINDGVVWADQDYKSSNHFYNIDTLKGLYGFSDLLNEFKKYYRTAMYYLDKNQIEKCMFYVGVCLHLIQDSTVPQHGSGDLFNEHRNFELWIVSKIYDENKFKIETGIQRFNRVEDYIIKNIAFSQKINIINKNIKDREKRYMNISCEILRRAHETTAGFLVDIYERINNII
ncbi:zinc dependent phospholipase C family protein [Candidatus Arthromitus sp. SFB-rat-Yit]|uniref:zinc dependent phospholipase C family protein n=1 Tax=Candidatus Arthromitus sp. SFB-rat-Yit TaxID=1041504 RepID=UPI000227A279|nr:zinc dependent phospholipase C family protein [Candidatus Arthromitus sp. SFB-rat-Yit]BAK80808.1 phospholipase C zinc-binding [Candidatus Arthromitus sp. SFB-rat-Yit]